jgi:hypothetical protein
MVPVAGDDTGGRDDVPSATESAGHGLEPWTCGQQTFVGGPERADLGQTVPWKLEVGAERLVLSPKTVRNQVSTAFSKLQVASRAEAIVRAREAGLG